MCEHKSFNNKCCQPCRGDYWNLALEQLLFLQGLVQNFVRSTLSLTFVIAAARVVFNIKARMTRETTWSLELKGELTKQRRVEAVDKLLTVLTLLVASVFGLQAIGLDGELFHLHLSYVKCSSVIGDSMSA